MNAYELLEKITGLNSCEPVIIKACEDVIHQQAKRIEELEKDLEGCEYFLKTHPHKELSDEEIKAIIVQHIQTWNSLDNIIDFARAIIKASRGEE